eukprot:109297_1
MAHSTRQPFYLSLSIANLYQEHQVPYHILSAMENIQYAFDKCPGVLREAYRMKLSTLDIDRHSFVECVSDFLYDLSTIGIDNELAQTCIQAVKENALFVRTGADCDDLVKILLDELEKQKWSGIKCNLFILKYAFQKLYSNHLMTLRDPLMKRQEMTAKHLYDVLKSISIQIDDDTAIPLFDSNTSIRISRYLYIKMMDDINRNSSTWSCKKCGFVNCKLMVDGIWRFYNHAKKCALCGRPRMVLMNDMKQEKESFHKSDDTETPWVVNRAEWDEVDQADCPLFKSVQHLSTNQLGYLLRHYFFERIYKTIKMQLSKYEDQIIEYFLENRINGKRFMRTNKKSFCKSLRDYLKNSKIFDALQQLYKVIKECDLTDVRYIPKMTDDDMKSDDDYQDVVSTCPALQRVKMILGH